jgi:hypothetical protein
LARRFFFTDAIEKNTPGDRDQFANWIAVKKLIEILDGSREKVKEYTVRR